MSGVTVCKCLAVATVIIVFFSLEMKSFPQAQHKSLQVGSRPPRPSYVPAHLPALPDPHTYIKTPVSLVYK